VGVTLVSELVIWSDDMSKVDVQLQIELLPLSILWSLFIS